ncbi:MAG: bacteriophage Gp15 family protein [Oscillospiraceae bacterium]|nr:bacteriophage Gp15 family protein [Oscillospiraceae bacterium]
MNLLLDKLPDSVLIDGAAVPINTDFRVCLKIIQAMEDDVLMEHEKLTVLMDLLYPEPPENTALALSQGLKFLNLGKEADSAKLNQPQVYSLEKDSNYIYTAFKSSFNIDLNEVEYLHWWKFRSLFADLDKDCFFNTLVSLRSRQQSGKLTDSEKDFVRRNADLMSLTEVRHSTAVQDFISKIGRR